MDSILLGFHDFSKPYEAEDKVVRHLREDPRLLVNDPVLDETSN
jgi:hypothetical protein